MQVLTSPVIRRAVLLNPTLRGRRTIRALGPIYEGERTALDGHFGIKVECSSDLGVCVLPAPCSLVKMQPADNPYAPQADFARQMLAQVRSLQEEAKALIIECPPALEWLLDDAAARQDMRTALDVSRRECISPASNCWPLRLAISYGAQIYLRPRICTAPKLMKFRAPFSSVSLPASSQILSRLTKADPIRRRMWDWRGRLLMQGVARDGVTAPVPAPPGATAGASVAAK